MEDRTTNPLMDTAHQLQVLFEREELFERMVEFSRIPCRFFQ